MQRSKGDAKQSTLQRFAPVSKQTSTAPRQLRRSATVAAASEPAKQKRKARRSSSDSALLLRGAQQQPPDAAASNDLDDDSEEVLPNRLLKPKSGLAHPRHVSPASTPATALEARAAIADLPNTPELPSTSPQSPACVHIQTSIVGRRFRTNITCTRYTQVKLVRQPDNPRDSNAIQVVDTAKQAVLGYLPREIAQHLAGLMDAGSVQVTATVDEPKSVAASVPILLQVLYLDCCQTIGLPCQVIPLCTDNVLPCPLAICLDVSHWSTGFSSHAHKDVDAMSLCTAASPSSARSANIQSHHHVFCLLYPPYYNNNNLNAFQQG